jgi:hypothetical protein
MTNRIFIVCALLFLIGSARAQTTAPAGVQAKLSLVENKTVFRIGEPIKLVLEFTADREGYIADYMPDGKEAGSDALVISPDTGFTYWFDELNDNRGMGRDVLMTDKVSRSSKPVEIILNDKVRFDSPGRYSISVTTNRVRTATRDQAIVLSTNAVTFEVRAMSEEDEAKEVKRLSELIDSKRDTLTRDEAARQLSYLTGDASTREKARRFFDSTERTASYYQHFWYGLFIARNRALALKLIENGMRDPNIPVTTQIFFAATRLKTLLTHGPREKSRTPVETFIEVRDPRDLEIKEAYVVELAAGLSKRIGQSQTTTAITLLTNIQKDSPSTSVQLREVRRILVQQFDSLEPFSQEGLLRAYWEVLRDPALVPSLKKMLKWTGVAEKNLHETALQRLADIAPEEIRPYVVAEILNANSLVDSKILGLVQDESLPEVDLPLLDQIRALATSTQGRDQIYLTVKAPRLVRFATDKIYQPLLDLYQSRKDKLPADVRGAFLAYFSKHNEREAVPLIEQAASELNSQQYNRVLSNLTELYYSEAIGTILKKLLEMDDTSVARHAAYLIGRNGLPGDEKVLEARLKRWQEEWRDRVVEADSRNQGQIERELIYALINGKAWKLSESRVKELRTGCLTQLCKSSNPEASNPGSIPR